MREKDTSTAFTTEFIRDQRKERVFRHFSEPEVADYFKRIMNMRQEIVGGELKAQPIENYFISRDKLPIYYKYWLPKDSPKRVLLMCHGFQCHSDLFFPLADYFYNKRTIVGALDLRGHGRTGPVRGDIKDFSSVYEDLKILIHLFKSKFSVPIYLMGESLGGLVVLHYSLKFPHDVSGIITLAPGLKPKIFDVAKKVLPVLTLLIYLLYPVFSNKPVLALPQDFNNPTYFPSFNEFDRKDFMHTQRISLNLILNLLKYFKTSSAIMTGDFKVPLLICQGTGDKALDFRGAKELYENIKIKGDDTKLIFYKNANHSLLLDMKAKKIYDDIFNWIEIH